jgi:hypothetical protein
MGRGAGLRMQVQETTQIGAAESAPSSPAGSAAGDWLLFGAGAVVFLTIIGLLMVGRVRGGGGRKSRSTEFFHPAGEGAEIAFDDQGAPAVRIAPTGRRAKAPPAPAESEAEVVIERAAGNSEPELAAPEDSPAARRQGPFASLFARKRREEPIVEAEPVEEESARRPDLRPSSRDHGVRRRDDDERRSEAEPRAAFEPEAEFERPPAFRREPAQDHVRPSYTEDLRAEALRRELSAEIDERVAALAGRLDSRLDRRLEEREAFASDAAALLREIDERVAHLADRLEAVVADRPAAPRAGDADRAVAELKEEVAGAFLALERRIDEAAARKEVETLRAEFASLKTQRLRRPIAGPLVPLADLLRTALPPEAYELRATLPNGRMADGLVRLAAGAIAVDARFPVEALSGSQDLVGEDAARAESDVRRLLRDAVDAARGLIAPGLAPAALLYAPSDALFADLAARFPDVIEDGRRARVHVVSPASLTATLAALRTVAEAPPRSSAPNARVFSELDSLRRRVATLELEVGQVRPTSDLRPPSSEAPAARIERAPGAKPEASAAVPTARRRSDRFAEGDLGREEAEESGEIEGPDQNPPHFPLR